MVSATTSGASPLPHNKVRPHASACVTELLARSIHIANINARRPPIPATNDEGSGTEVETAGVPFTRKAPPLPLPSSDQGPKFGSSPLPLARIAGAVPSCQLTPFPAAGEPITIQY